MFVVVSPHLFKAAYLVKGTSHIEILKSHCRLKECLELQITENEFLLHAPVAKIRIPLIYASPNLQSLIYHPYALIFAILRNAVRVIDDVFVTFEIQLEFRLNSKRAYSDHQQKTSWKKQNISIRIIDTLQEKWVPLIKLFTLSLFVV